MHVCVFYTSVPFETTSVLYQGVAWTRLLPALQTRSIALLKNDKYLMCLTVCMQNKRLCQKCSQITQDNRGHHMQWNTCLNAHTTEQHTHTHTHKQDHPLSLIQSMDLMFFIMGNTLILFNPV